MSRDDMHWPERDAFADLLAAERDIEPPPDSPDRVLGRVMATLAAVPPPDGPPGDGGAGAAAGETAAVAPAGPIGTAGQVATVGEAASAGVSMSVSIGTGVSGATVALIGGSVVGALALGAWLVLSPTETPPPPATPPTTAAAPDPVPEPSIAPPVAPTTPVAEPAEPVEPTVPPVVEPPPPAPRAVEPPRVVKTPPRRARPAPARPKAEPTPAPAPAPAVDDALRGELELLGAARKALAADDADAALKALRTHARRFPSGRFDQEREVLTIKVLVSQGRLDDARRRAAAFARRHPDSLHRSTIDALLPAAEPAAEPTRRP